jgi:hypothetical protein
MANRIFISYRREESKYQARMIYQAFSKFRPTTEVFMDVDTIPLGVDFVEVIRGWVQKCDVLLALVGAGWSESKDPKTGFRRLDNPNDFVRIEISEALKRGIPVVPVLLDDAPLPDRDQLPDNLRNLFDRNAAYVSYRTFDTDVEGLIKRLKSTSKKDLAETTTPSEPGIDALVQSPNAVNAPVVARSAEADEAVSAAQNIMTAIVKRDFDTLWNETSVWYKNKVGIKKPAYVASWALSRQSFAPLKSSDLIDVQFSTSDPSGYVGKMYVVTFLNEYENGKTYERVVLFEESGKFRLSNFVGAPAQ